MAAFVRVPKESFDPDHRDGFLHEGVVALGWESIKTDPTRFLGRREAFIAHVAANYAKDFAKRGTKPDHAASTIY